MSANAATDWKPSPSETASSVTGSTVLCTAPAGVNSRARIANTSEKRPRAWAVTSKKPSSSPRRNPGTTIQYHPNAL